MRKRQINAALFWRRHAASDRLVLVTVPTRWFLAIDGLGSPLGMDFQMASDLLHEAYGAVRRRLAGQIADYARTNPCAARASPLSGNASRSSAPVDTRK